MLLDIEKIMVAGADRQMTLTEVMNKAHMANATVKRIKNGEEVTMKSAGKLANVLGVKVADLLLKKSN